MKKKAKLGRKKVLDKVKPVTFWVKNSQIQAHGGIEKAREVAKRAFLNYTDVD